MTRKFDMLAMSVDELWNLHEELSRLLSSRMTDEKRELEKRLAQLRREEKTVIRDDAASAVLNVPRERRAYPRVLPKYRNPENPAETWSGRGKQPRWIAAALDAGCRIDELLIANGAKTTAGIDNRHRR